MRAEITAEADKKQWAGLGATVFYEVSPPCSHLSLPLIPSKASFPLPFFYEVAPHGPGQMNYHKIERYRQGVVFNIQGVGEVISFDMQVG